VKDKAQARKAEGLKGVKFAAGDNKKEEKQATLIKKDTAKTGRTAGHELLGFVGGDD
jgi:hypothetical protein